MNANKFAIFAIAMWIFNVAFVLGLAGFGVWAVYRLVTHFTGG